MKQAKDNVKLSSIKSKGKYLFCYSDKFNIFLFFSDSTDKTVYRITCDKYFTVIHVDDIMLPVSYDDIVSIKFFKPVDNRDGTHKFNGVINLKDGCHKFEIDAFDKLRLVSQAEPVNRKMFTIISCLDNVEVISYIQSKNKIYLTGYDLVNESNMYGVVDIEANGFSVYYMLYSDLGDVNPSSINIDISEEKVYVVGCLTKYDDSNNVKETAPYLESFMLN